MLWQLINSQLIQGLEVFVHVWKLIIEVKICHLKKKNPPLPNLFQPLNIFHSLVCDNFEVLLENMITKSV